MLSLYDTIQELPARYGQGSPKNFSPVRGDESIVFFRYDRGDRVNSVPQEALMIIPEDLDVIVESGYEPELVPRHIVRGCLTQEV